LAKDSVGDCVDWFQQGTPWEASRDGQKGQGKGMGEVITLAQRRAERQGRRTTRRRDRIRAEFYFDLACPFTYLAAERVERSFEDVSWRPASAVALRLGGLTEPRDVERTRVAAEHRAAELRLPLVWPERWPADVPGAMRAAAFAAEERRAGAFVLAAVRLAFCGGFDLDDPEILAEAAAAAGIGLNACLRAAGDPGRDGAIEGDARSLLAAGADRLPALRVGRALFWGEDRVGEAAAAARFAAAATATV